MVRWSNVNRDYYSHFCIEKNPLISEEKVQRNGEPGWSWGGEGSE